MRTDMVLDALEMASYSRRAGRLGRTGDPFGRRIAIHLGALHRAPRRDRSDTEHRHGRPIRSTMHWPRRSTASTRQSASTGPTPTAGRTSSHLELATLVMGALVQRRAPPRLLRLRPTSRVRSSVLRCPTTGPTGAWKSITRVSIRPRAIQSPQPVEVDANVVPCFWQRGGPLGLASDTAPPFWLDRADRELDYAKYWACSRRTRSFCAGALAKILLQGAHARLAHRGIWTLNEKRMVEWANLTNLYVRFSNLGWTEDDLRISGSSGISSGINQRD